MTKVEGSHKGMSKHQKMVITLTLDAIIGENVQPESVSGAVLEAIKQAIPDAMWMYLPGSRSNPDDKISVNLTDAHIEEIG